VAFDRSEPRDDHGRWTDGGGGTAAAAPARRPNPARDEAAKHVRAAGKYRDTARRRRVIAAVKREAELTDAIKGANLPDSEPADVVLARDPEGKPITDHAAVKQLLADRELGIRWQKNPPPELVNPDAPEHAAFVATLPPGTRAQLKQHYREDVAQRQRVARAMRSEVHLIEVKTLLTSKSHAVHMNKRALSRKLRWQHRYGALFHTVAVDDRRGSKHSGHRVHYAPDVGKTLKLDNMHKAGSMEHVARMILEGV
jgi:hypothetical protein